MTAPLERTGPKRGHRPQSFLRTKAAFSLDMRAIMSMDKDENSEEAFWCFTNLRYARTDGQPECPKCKCRTTYTIRRRNPRSIKFKCKACEFQFSPTSGTKLRYHKLSYRDLVQAIALFLHAPTGMAALEISGWIKCDYRTAQLLTHRIREIMADALAADTRPFEGKVEADTCWIGGRIRPKNFRHERDSESSKEIKNPYIYPYLGTGKKNVTGVVERGPNGRAFLAVADREADSRQLVSQKINQKTLLFTDKSSVYEGMGGEVAEHLTVNHSLYFWSGEADTNTVESLFAFVKRPARLYHKIAHPEFAELFMAEDAWRWTHRRVPTDEKFAKLIGA